jgi:hypothetical protein
MSAKTIDDSASKPDDSDAKTTSATKPDDSAAKTTSATKPDDSATKTTSATKSKPDDSDAKTKPNDSLEQDMTKKLKELAASYEKILAEFDNEHKKAIEQRKAAEELRKAAEEKELSVQLERNRIAIKYKKCVELIEGFENPYTFDKAPKASDGAPKASDGAPKASDGAPKASDEAPKADPNMLLNGKKPIEKSSSSTSNGKKPIEKSSSSTSNGKKPIEKPSVDEDGFTPVVRQRVNKPLVFRSAPSYVPSSVSMHVTILPSFFNNSGLDEDALGVLRTGMDGLAYNIDEVKYAYTSGGFNIRFSMNPDDLNNHDKIEYDNRMEKGRHVQVWTLKTNLLEIRMWTKKPPPTEKYESGYGSGSGSEYESEFGSTSTRTLTDFIRPR